MRYAVIGGVIGTVLGGAAAYTLFHDDASTTDNSTSDSCEDDEPHCSMASPYQIAQAGIDNEHDFKKDYVDGSLSRYDICACEDGSIKIAGRGQCGKSGPKIDTWARWK